jgi:serine phosphatase RsbU (regulator of sigma subunit)
MPPAAVGLSAVLGRPDLRFQSSGIGHALDHLEGQDYHAALIVAPHASFNGRQQQLVHLLDELYTRHIGTIMLTFSTDDQHAALRMAGADGLMAVPHTCTAAELSGRIDGLLAAKPIVDQLHRENAMLRKFDSGLNSQMTQLDEEMRLAARIQRDFLPRKLPELDGCRFDVLFRPASYVSGDIYDAVRLDEHHLGFYVADAVGHGMPAALLTIFLKRTLKTKDICENGYRIVPPHEALAMLNEEMVGQQLSMCQFVTMAYGILDTRTLELQYARAGHPLPLLLGADGTMRELDAEGALLGVFPNEIFPQATAQLQPGDAVLIYSDGFESAFPGPAGIVNERFQMEFAALAGADPSGRFAAMMAKLDHQEGSLHPRDDLTAIMLTVGSRPTA